MGCYFSSTCQLKKRNKKNWILILKGEYRPQLCMSMVKKNKLCSGRQELFQCSWGLGKERERNTSNSLEFVASSVTCFLLYLLSATCSMPVKIRYLLLWFAGRQWSVTFIRKQKAVVWARYCWHSPPGESRINFICSKNKFPSKVVCTPKKCRSHVCQCFPLALKCIRTFICERNRSSDYTANTEVQ